MFICSYVIKIHEQISLHLLPYGELPSLFISTVVSTLARAEHCTWHVGSLCIVVFCMAWLLWHEHLINFSKSIGASKVSAGTVVGLSTPDPSSLDHPKSVGFRTGGFGSKACNQTATWRWAMATFSWMPHLWAVVSKVLAHWLCFYKLWARTLFVFVFVFWPLLSTFQWSSYTFTVTCCPFDLSTRAYTQACTYIFTYTCWHKYTFILFIT